MSPEAWLSAPPRFGAGPGLHRLHSLLSPLRDQPWWQELRALRVVGSDGKGSTCAFLDSLLRADGASVGLYTSPHLLRFHERMQHNGQPIDDAALQAACAWTRAQVEAYEAQHPQDPVGSFERTTLCAMRWFSALMPSALVVEAGLGGRLDSTRVVPGKIVGVCPIDLEHQALLGRTREEILADKLELAPDGGKVVLGALPPELQRRARGQLEARGVSVYRAQDLARFSAPRFVQGQMWAELELPEQGLVFPALRLGLVGRHQLGNAALALGMLSLAGPLDPEPLRRGLEQVRWPGRMQQISAAPETWLDAAHTPQGALAAASTARELAGARPIVWVASASADKDLGALLSPLAAQAAEILCTQAQERATPAEDLRAALGRGQAVADPLEALTLAQERARSLGGLVLVAGSLFVVRELLSRLG